MRIAFKLANAEKAFTLLASLVEVGEFHQSIFGNYYLKARLFKYLHKLCLRLFENFLLVLSDVKTFFFLQTNTI